ncbi:hypothetical protein [Desulfocurvibacter africanus]|uniref:hypothetical protein n=1 Tax=Desulfocurvibacter africanus TaxID=873 RepID=UPI00048447BE|nr:hypothetical protein [Desulfocurvibacter africanus]
MYRELLVAIFTVICFGTLFAGIPNAQAQEVSPQRPGSTPRAVPEAEKESSPRIPVIVEHAGSDPIGIRLAFALKETFGKSTLFRLAVGEEKKITLRMATKAEFTDRPGLASGWAVIWLFTEQSDVLGFYLESDLGFTGREDLGDVAVSVASRTEEIAKRFSYLFE